MLVFFFFFFYWVDSMTTASSICHWSSSSTEVTLSTLLVGFLESTWTSFLKASPLFYMIDAETKMQYDLRYNCLRYVISILEYE